ncbi:MAG: hypothetical protein AB4042_19915 [Leptolyngbyaceae cyanobacterium]
MALLEVTLELKVQVFTLSGEYYSDELVYAIAQTRPEDEAKSRSLPIDDGLVKQVKAALRGRFPQHFFYVTHPLCKPRIIAPSH